MQPPKHLTRQAVEAGRTVRLGTEPPSVTFDSEPLAALVQEEPEALVGEPTKRIRGHKRQHPRSKTPGKALEAFFLLDDADSIKHAVCITDLWVRRGAPRLQERLGNIEGICDGSSHSARETSCSDVCHRRVRL